MKKNYGLKIGEEF